MARPLLFVEDVEVRRWLMKALRLLLVGSLLLFASGPTKAEDAPAYVNAEVVRYDKNAHTLAFRGSRGEEKLAVDEAIIPTVIKLKNGDKVILTTRVVSSNEKGEVKIVTEVRPASETSGEPGKATAYVAPPAAVVAAPPPVITVPKTVVVTPGPAPNPAGGIPVNAISGIPSIPYPTPPPTAVVVAAQVPAGATAEEKAFLEFEATAAAKALEAADIDLSWAAFRQTCLKEEGPPPAGRRDWFRLFTGQILPQSDDACRRAHEDLQARAEKFKSDIATLTQEAQKARVLPGRIREVLQRNNIDL